MDDSLTSISINVSDLKFHEGNSDPWKSFPEEPEKGIVGCCDMDRAEPWDIFVVVSYEKESDVIYAIMPRIRIDKDNNILLGVDKLSEKFEPVVKCKCRPPRQGEDFCCHCGAKDEVDSAYVLTFKPVSADYKYKVIRFKRPLGYPFFDFVTKEMVNRLDSPCSPVCCEGCI